ncbi:hypothetical protein MRX96_026121 [Rhipicephalus microplus]
MKYDEVPVLFDFTALVYLAGYLAFVCEEKVACPACKLQLKGKASRECAYQDPYHCEELCELFIKKLLRPLLANWAGDLNSSFEDILKLSRKPLSRKVLRL